jgi:meso-butanediol dehydrogenase / (S,S)-butanediol dehydrogenase / diacetyl reductase
MRPVRMLVERPWNGNCWMMKRLGGKVALITGGGSGIGAATARRLSDDGAHTVVLGRRAAPLKAVAEACNGMAVVGDTARCEDIELAVRHACDAYGGLDILVVSAGVEQFGSVETVTLEDWRRVFSINLDGAMLAARAAIPALRARGGGAIVLVSSVAAVAGAPSYAAYCSSKAALSGLNRSIAVDYGPENIRCNAICPGWTLTELALREIEDTARKKGIDALQLQHELTGNYPLRRMGRPEEIAAVIAFLASNDASFVTGTMLSADGGGGIVDIGTLPFM